MADNRTMQTNDSLSDLKLLVKSSHGLIGIESSDAMRVEKLLQHLADSLSLPYFSWIPTKGLRRDGETDSIYNTTDPIKALQHIEASRFPAIYHFANMDGLLEPLLLIQHLKNVTQAMAGVSGAVILTAVDLNLPPPLVPFCAEFKLPMPTKEEYRDLIRHLVRDLGTRMNISVQLSAPDGQRLLTSLKGLTLMEAKKILTKLMVQDGLLNAKDIPGVVMAKKDIVAKDGILEYTPVEENMADIADLAGLKDWLSKRREIIRDPVGAKAFGLSFPKGILLLGVQGCGKSLCAKAISMEWNLPLLRLDPSNLYNKWVGDTEKNMKSAMQTAEKMAPVILWIDEIEKGFVVGDSSGDSGTSLRILGSFLNWMQERKGDVFIIATANDIERLPPEFLRKGRFDEIFFVDLPSPEARDAVFHIHLRKRKRDPSHFNIPQLVAATEGFSPAEIEQVIVSSLYSAYSARSELTQDLLLREIGITRPLSITMAEKVQGLRAWARERTVSAQ